MSSTCVIYAPFQIAGVGGFHATVIEKAFAEHDHVIFALPTRRVSPSKDSPLSFEERKALLWEYLNPQAQRRCGIVEIVEKKYAADVVTTLESAIKAPLASVVFVSDPSMVHGFYLKTPCAFLSEEKKLRATAHVGISNREYRLGVIRGLNDMFPISWVTVDIAIRRVDYGLVDGRQTCHKVLYLFGKKPGERGWRFPGGFKDRSDHTLESAVFREAGEETLRVGVDPEQAFSLPEYVCSKNVDDWRYVRETDGVTTVFYRVSFLGALDQIKAGDDLADARWFELSEMHPSMMEGEHSLLLEELRAFEDKDNHDF